MPVQDQTLLPETQQFFLQGFQEEKKEIMRLMAKNDIAAAKERFLRNASIAHALACPLGASYFHTFLLREHNVENLQAYFEAKQLSDFLLTSHKKARFNLDLLREYDNNVEQQLADLNLDGEHSSDEEACANSTEPHCQQFNSLTQEKKDSFRKVFGSDKREIQKVEHRIQKFINKYVGKNATSEVNIPATSQKEFLDAFAKFKQNIGTTCSTILSDDKDILEKKQVIVDGMEERMQIMEKALNKFREEIIVNLTDPFARFIVSDTFHEVFVLFFTVEDPDFHRKRILEAGHGGVVLNEDFEWKQDMQARHPLTVVNGLLTKLLGVVRAPSLWTWMSNFQGDAKSAELGINYAELPTVKDWKCVRDESAELQLVDLSLLSNDYERAAFWINTYNTIILHAALIARGIPILICTRELFFRKTKYNIGGKQYSLQDIRNAMLRGKELQRSHCTFQKVKSKDSRWQFALQDTSMVPLINFALADLSAQSANIRVFTPENTKQNLEELTIEWLKKNVQVSTGSEVHLTFPFLLHEISSDFKKTTGASTDGVVNFVVDKLQIQGTVVAEYKDTNVWNSNFSAALGDALYKHMVESKEAEKQQFIKSQVQQPTKKEEKEESFSWARKSRNAKIKIHKSFNSFSNLLTPRKKSAKCLVM